MRFGIYDQHDFRFTLTDSNGHQYEGCRGCGYDRGAIERNGLRCIRPMVPLEGTLLELHDDGAAADDFGHRRTVMVRVPRHPDKDMVLDLGEAEVLHKTLGDMILLSRTHG